MPAETRRTRALVAILATALSLTALTPATAAPAVLGGKTLAATSDHLILVDDDDDDDDHHHRRHKHKRKHRHEHDVVHRWHRAEPGYAVPYGIGGGTCHRDLIGAVLGGAVGGLAGSQIGKGSGNTAAIIGGAIAGVLVGGSIGRSMDEIDQTCAAQVFEHAPDRQPIVWNNPDGGRYTVVPVRTFEPMPGRYCREYTATAVVAGRPQETYGTACRQPDGSWEIVG